MFARSRIWLVITIAIVLCSNSTAAEKYALLVAVNRYNDDGMNEVQLRYPEADAKSIAKHLRDSGFSVDLLLGEDANKASVVEKLSGLKSKGGDGGTVMVGLFGHGLQYGDDPYFAPFDTVRRVVKDSDGNKLRRRNGRLLYEPDPESLLPVSVVFDTLEGAVASNRLVIADCCRSDPNRARSGVKARAFKTTISSAELPRNTAVLFACSEGEVALEDDRVGHGVFTQAILDGLDGKAGDAIGQVTWDSLVGYVRSAVSNRPVENASIETQTPHAVGNLRGASPVLTPKYAWTSSRRKQANEAVLRLAKLESKRLLQRYSREHPKEFGALTDSQVETLSRLILFARVLVFDGSQNDIASARSAAKQAIVDLEIPEVQAEEYLERLQVSIDPQRPRPNYFSVAPSMETAGLVLEGNWICPEYPRIDSALSIHREVLSQSDIALLIDHCISQKNSDQKFCHWLLGWEKSIAVLREIRQVKSLLRDRLEKGDLDETWLCHLLKSLDDKTYVAEWFAQHDRFETDVKPLIGEEPIVIVFAASWCPPCLVWLDSLASCKRRSDFSIVLLQVDSDDSGTQTSQDWKALVAKWESEGSFKDAWPNSSMDREVFGHAIPFSIGLGTEGQVRVWRVGNTGSADSFVEKLLAD